jgi:cyclophilin family peptidyl-prolyl cis-trans isomerase
MPPAEKRARKKENARAAREQREAALKRKKRTRSVITVGVVAIVFIGVVILISVGGKSKAKTATTTPTTTPTSTAAAKTVATVKLDPTKTYTATITTNFGTIKIQLDAKNAPIGAGRFALLADNGVYNGSRWHRVIKGFVIQGGAPGGDPTKDYGHAVVAEVPKGAYKLGDVAAAKTQTDPNGTFDSQFFIVTGPQGEALPDQYADFGHVTSGMAVVRTIEALPTDANQDPTKTATIAKVTVTAS